MFVPGFMPMDYREPTTVKLSRTRTAQAAWTAIALDGRRLDVARMHTGVGQRPRLAVFSSVQCEPEAVATLRRVAKDLRIEKDRISALLPHGDYDLLPVEAPDVPAEELRTAVRWRLKDVLEYPPEAATIDVLPLPQSPSPAGRAAQLIAVATRSERIASCIELFDTARLGLSAIDIQEMAQRNVAALFEEGERAVAMVSFSEKRGLLTVSAKGQLYLARNLEIGTEVIERTAAEARSGLMDRLALELQRSLDHFDRQFGGLQVSRLLVVPFAQADALRVVLAESLYVAVEILDLARVIDLDGVPALRDPEAQGRHVRVLGAALRSL